MKQGYLSQYFSGVALKKLSAVEANPMRSNQHEFNGDKSLRSILGEPSGKTTFQAKFLFLSDQNDVPLVKDGFLTWYDARERARTERGVMRWEYRLYFPTNPVSARASEGDLLVIAKRTDGGLLAIIAEKDTTIEQQLMWLFGLPSLSPGRFSINDNLDAEQNRIGFAARIILEQIGIEPEEESQDHLEEMLNKFGKNFPRSSEFSAYARGTIPNISSRENPDKALLAWMEQEEILFRTFEKHLLGTEIRTLVQAGENDPEPYIRQVQSTLQRRRSRAGSALENHLEKIFTDHGVTYTRTAVTENRLKPDFIFPGITHYRDPAFPETNLTMLASKTTCKDRWRQILNEAARIPCKHLITLEPGISEHQTKEMKTVQVQLVLPDELHQTYTPSQQEWLMSLKSFIELTSKRQGVL